MKKAIAMRCTQKQFDAVKPKLGILKFDTCYQKFTKEYPYLTNYYSDQKNNLGWTNKLLFRTEMIEEWDEKAFLDACGIETTVFPTLEEIKEYFKDAKTIKCLDDNDEYIVDLSKDFDVTKNCIYLLNQIDVPFSGSPTMCKVWGLKDGYAQILTKKPNRLDELEKRISVLENKVDLKKIADMPENPIKMGYEKGGDYHSDMIDAMQHAIKVPIPNYKKGNTFNGKQSLIINDQEKEKMFSNDASWLSEVFEVPSELITRSESFANNSSIDAFKKAFNSIDTDPKNEVNRLKLRIEELEAEITNSKALNNILNENIDFWQKEAGSMLDFIEGIKNTTHNFLGMK